MKKALVLGASGQVGKDLCQLLSSMNVEFLSPTSIELDLTNTLACREFYRRNTYDTIFNCAAFTNVDLANHMWSNAWKINTQGVFNVVEQLKNPSIKLVHVSTDYVFGYHTPVLLDENKMPCPLNSYGFTKLYGEFPALLSGGCVLRTSAVYGVHGSCFPRSLILKTLGRPDQTVFEISQGRTKPTWAKHLAKYMVQCVTLNVPSGLYHVADATESSWSDWARTVLSAAFTPEQYSVRPLEEHEENNPQRACRPLYSVLDCSVIENHGIAMKSISSEELESLTRIWLKEGGILLHQHS